MRLAKVARLVAMLALSFVAAAHAAEPPNFDKTIAPLLARRCLVFRAGAASALLDSVLPVVGQFRLLAS